MLNKMFLEALADLVPDDERVLVSTVPGSPEDAGGEVWNVRPWTFGTRPPPVSQNNYVCVSAFRRGPTGWRRKAEAFGRALAFMVDDIGTKVPRETMEGTLPPSAIIITSPGNEQWWWFFSEPVASYELFSRFVSAFVQQRLGGKDPGMGGANRVGRLPGGINGKDKYKVAGKPFSCELFHWSPTLRYTLGELVASFDLKLAAPRRVRTHNSISDVEMQWRRAEYEEVLADVSALGMLLKRHANVSGRTPILCPWYNDHTNAAKTGTYLVEPSEQNNWRGSFVCYHSSTHNNDNHLKDLKLWASDMRLIILATQMTVANQKVDPDLYKVLFPAERASTE